MKQLIRYLLPHGKVHKHRIIGSIILGLLIAGIKGLQAFMVKYVVDDALIKGSSWEEVSLIAGAYLITGLVFFPSRFFHFYWIRYVVDRISCDIRYEIFSKLQKLPMSFYTKTRQGGLISNILNDTMVFAQGFRSAIDLVREPATAIVMIGVAVYSDWQLSLIILVITPLFIIVFSKSGKRIKNNQGHVQEELAQVTHNINEGVNGQKITKAFNLQNYVLNRFTSSQDKFFNAQMRTTFVEEMAHPFVEFVGVLGFVGAILFAHYRISIGETTMGDFMRFIGALALLMDPIRKFSQANVKINQTLAAGARIFQVLEREEEVDKGVEAIDSFRDCIEINNLSFSYGDGYVLKDVSIKIKKGQKVALVGLSGSGKSTLINLILGLYDLKEGNIKIDGTDISKIKLKELRNIFGLVSQDIFLFHDTVLENLKIGNDFSDSQINEALEVAYAHEFINKLPHGIETVIGDKGARLSGGQQQRVTIARAFLQQREVLLFDEATSALDNESEKVVQKALDQLGEDKTVIGVAHRLTTIQEFDQIFVFKEGRLVEFGKHDELMNLSGEYAKLYVLSHKS